MPISFLKKSYSAFCSFYRKIDLTELFTIKSIINVVTEEINYGRSGNR